MRICVLCVLCVSSFLWKLDMQCILILISIYGNKSWNPYNNTDFYFILGTKSWDRMEISLHKAFAKQVNKNDQSQCSNHIKLKKLTGNSENMLRIALASPGAEINAF